MKPSTERSSTHSRTIIIFIIENNKYIEFIFRPNKPSPSILCVRGTRETKRTYFCLKVKPFYSNLTSFLDAKFARDDIEIMRAMPEAARHKRAQLLEHKSAGRNSSPPDTRLQVVETRGFRLPSRSRTVEALRRVEITNLWRYPLKASLPPLSLSSFYPSNLFHGAIWRNSCRRFPIRHLLTAASRMRRTMAAALFDCNSFFPSVSQWRRKLGSLNGANSRAASHLYARHLSGDRLMDGCLQFRSRLDTSHFNERVTNDDAFSLIVFVFLPLSLLRIICRSIGSNGRNFLVSFFFLLYLIENCFIYSSY